MLRTARPIRSALMISAASLTGLAAYAAAPPAGSVIGNQASATYVNASGDEIRVTSNKVETVVQPVAGVTIEDDNTESVAPGGKVFLPHTITNAGNDTDVFDITTAEVNVGGGSGPYDFTSIRIFADADFDGVADSTTPIAVTPNRTPPRLGMSGKGDSGRGQRHLRTRVKSARGRKLSSTRWLDRQLNDPYVKRAAAENLRSRAAYKLIEIDEKFRLLAPGMRVVDLGCAPGGWTLVAAERVNATGAKAGQPRGFVLGVDLQAVDPVPRATLLQLDFMADGADETVEAALGGPADLVLSDMAAASSGHKATDHLRIVALCETAAHFARAVLAPGGGFVAKVLQGGTETALLADLKRDFAAVRHFKPPASRSDSAEMYIVATGFRGRVD